MDKFDFVKFLEDAKEYMNRNEIVQASEKLYKCAEEVVKLLAQKLELPEYLESRNNRRWDARLLFSAVNKLFDRFTEDFRRYWAGAWFLHIEGFHERRLTQEDVSCRIKDIENLIKFRHYE